MGHGLDPRPQSMRGGAMLVRRYVRVLSPCLPPAFPAAADMHPEQADFRFRRRVHIRYRYFFRFFPLQASTAEGAASFLDGNIKRGTAAGVGERFLTARELSLPWLASRPLRILLPLALGKPRCTPLILAAEFLVPLSQVLDLPLQLQDQADQIVSAEGIQIRHTTLWADSVCRSTALKSGYACSLTDSR